MSIESDVVDLNFDALGLVGDLGARPRTATDETAGDELARTAFRLKQFEESLDTFHRQILSAFATSGLLQKTICHNYGLNASQLQRLLQKWQEMLGLQNSAQLIGFWRLWADRTGAEATAIAPTVLRRLDTVVRNRLPAKRNLVDASLAAKKLTARGRFDLLSTPLWIEYLRALDRLAAGQEIVAQLSHKRLVQHAMLAGLHGLRPAVDADAAAEALNASDEEDIYFFVAMHLSYFVGHHAVASWKVPKAMERFFVTHRADPGAMHVLFPDVIRTFVRRRPALYESRCAGEGQTARACAILLFESSFGDRATRRLDESDLMLGNGLAADAGLFAMAFPEQTRFSQWLLERRIEFVATQPFSPRDLDRAWGLLALGYEFDDRDLLPDVAG